MQTYLKCFDSAYTQNQMGPGEVNVKPTDFNLKLQENF